MVHISQFIGVAHQLYFEQYDFVLFNLTFIVLQDLNALSASESHLIALPDELAVDEGPINGEVLEEHLV